ncbi:MAG: polyphosphate kinase 2 [Planctomycetota bacterium]
MSKDDDHYKKDLRRLQIDLVDLQRDVIEKGRKLLVILEGRDAAGKDGTIKRMVQHLSPRETRVVALGKPSDRDVTQWYYQRWVEHLPAGGEIVVFNRSWYNRAGVERVMGFCDEDQLRRFFDTVVDFERMLVGSGIEVLKYYLDISRDEQEERLEDRREDPLARWKISPIDAVALEHFDDYTAARDEMFVKTHHRDVPWTVVNANHKRPARLALIGDLLLRTRRSHEEEPDSEVVFRFDTEALTDGRLAR